MAHRALIRSRRPIEEEGRVSVSLESCDALVLNADYRPLSYFPLSLWSWQDAIKAAFLERVDIVSEYDLAVHSPSCEIRLPSVIALKQYVPLARRPAFTRFNVFLRDRFACQYCSGRFAVEDLTFDHVVPRSRGGLTSWGNVVTACSICNLAKGSRMPNECGLRPRHAGPFEIARQCHHRFFFLALYAVILIITLLLLLGRQFGGGRGIGCVFQSRDPWFGPGCSCHARA